MRVTGVEELLELLDGVFEGRVDSTSRAASEHWDGILLREGHPLNTELPDARRRTEAVEFLEVDFLREEVPGGPYDLVYDSGCFHHLAPHRRLSYVKALREVLAPGGYFGICTFTAGLMGSDEPDDVLMRSGRLGEGVGYTEVELDEMFSWLELVDSGPMAKYGANANNPVFTQDFLTVALFRNPAKAAA
ncbi:class I SAM-dependent methyltransferase [Kribbella deserti]|uniref:Class I SAM-dependent methyltransferase n=1 Tax=Kribbella deserti TaxID=1926257 RepID=A0ABV6QVH9_9ACTN